MEAVTEIRVLLVEDDQKLAQLVKEFLEARGGFRVSLEERGDKAVQRILDEVPHLVILDLMLPGLDGIEVCRQVRRKFPNPIIMLTALDQEVDEIVGLEVGADDYLSKPVSPRLLLSRIKTALRRASGAALYASALPATAHATANDSAPIICDNLVINPAARAVSYKGKPINLTTSEYDLLMLLAKRAGEPVNRDEIYMELRGGEWDGIDRSVDQRVRRLREKLGDDAKAPSLILSVRGTGYQLAVSS